MAKYVIIGNSAGGIGAAEAIREMDAEGFLAIISEEATPAYSRPLISEYLAGRTTLARMLYRPESFYHEKGILFLAGRKAMRLDVESHLAFVEDGTCVEWERLLLATGGVPFVPKVEGIEKDGVFTFTTLEDARRLRERLSGATQAVVIGGGLIGISVTEALVQRGIGVTVVELKDRVLNVILDEGASRLAEKALRRAGVRVFTQHTVRAILGRREDSSSVGGVVLDDGQQLACDLVVVAIGVVPRAELAKASGLEVNRGIVVDRRMRTSHPDIYACGDVAEAYDFLYGAGRLTPIWPNAYLGGRIAGFNMAGREVEYPGSTAMNSLSYFGLPIISAGMVNPNGVSNVEVLVTAREDKNIYKKIAVKDGHIVGMVFVGEVGAAGIVFGLMRDRISVEDFAEALISDNFGFLSLPREMRQRRLATA